MRGTFCASKVPHPAWCFFVLVDLLWCCAVACGCDCGYGSMVVDVVVVVVVGVVVVAVVVYACGYVRFWCGCGRWDCGCGVRTRMRTTMRGIFCASKVPHQSWYFLCF